MPNCRFFMYKVYPTHCNCKPLTKNLTKLKRSRWGVQSGPDHRAGTYLHASSIVDLFSFPVNSVGNVTARKSWFRLRLLIQWIATGWLFISVRWYEVAAFWHGISATFQYRVRLTRQVFILIQQKVLYVASSKRQSLQMVVFVPIVNARKFFVNAIHGYVLMDIGVPRQQVEPKCSSWRGSRGHMAFSHCMQATSHFVSLGYQQWNALMGLVDRNYGIVRSAAFLPV